MLSPEQNSFFTAPSWKHPGRDLLIVVVRMGPDCILLMIIVLRLKSYSLKLMLTRVQTNDIVPC